jgi:hypothetical protein
MIEPEICELKAAAKKVFELKRTKENLRVCQDAGDLLSRISCMEIMEEQNNATPH